MTTPSRRSARPGASPRPKSARAIVRPRPRNVVANRPARPELYPEYLEPGWWCYEAEIKGVTLSECQKYREACEHALAELRPTASRTSAACSRLAQSPVCFRFDVPTPLNPVQFMCFPSTQHCEEVLRGRANWPTNPSLDKVRLITACETWRGEEAP